MFDFSFSELMVVMVVALIVIGPERLPKVARTLGHLWGRAQRYVNGVKADLERDMAIEEFRELQQKVKAEAEAAQQSITQAARTLDQRVQQVNAAIAQPLPEKSITATEQQLKPPAEPVSNRTNP